MQNFSNATFDTERAKDFFMNQISFNIGSNELKKMIKNDLKHFKLIDLRNYQDYIDEHIPYAIHIPFEEIENHWNMFDKDKINILYSHNNYCFLAKKTALILAEKNYPVMELHGGFYAWKKIFNLETITTDSPQEKNI